MPYSTGMLDKRIQILNRAESTDGDFGRKSGAYELAATVWAAVDWNHGAKAMREGAFDAYDTLMIRCRWNSLLTRESRIGYNDRIYQIESFNESKPDNQIQLTVSELQK